MKGNFKRNLTLFLFMGSNFMKDYSRKKKKKRFMSLMENLEFLAKQNDTVFEN